MRSPRMSQREASVAAFGVDEDEMADAVFDHQAQAIFDGEGAGNFVSVLNGNHETHGSDGIGGRVLRDRWQESESASSV